MSHFQAPSLIGEVLDGRYKITRKLGEGGMGEVFAAEHVHIEKRFAVKLLRPEIVSNAEAVQRFRQEARSASSIGHRNIIAIEDFGQLPDGRIYMCMELLNGAALNDLIQTPIAVDRLLNILIQTGHGLAAAHAKGIIHRDMKPENIFVTIGVNQEDVPKLLDFGIAKVAGNDGQNNLTRTGTIFGTPFYMAPEQALGNPVDARTDVYAMGVIMYEMFAGSLPFQGESFMGILTQHITTEPEPVAQRAAKAGRQLPMGLAEIITRCMQKNPAQRYGTMDELVNALIQIYRGIAGPGMSTYMEAFPVGPSGRHAVPTPPPLTGPVNVGAAHAPTQGPHVLPHGHGTGPMPLPTGGSGPNHMIPTAGSSSALYPGYSGVPITKKSNTGLIVAILAVLLVGGGVAIFAAVGGKEGGGGSGSGSQVAVVEDAAGGGSSGSGETSAADAMTAPVDAAVAASVDAAEEPPKPADAAVVVPETVDVLIKSRYHGAFEVWEDDQKLFDGPDNLPVVVGESRKITIKARGYKDKTFTVSSDAKGRKFEFKLDRAPGPVPGPGSGSSSVKPPVDPGCKNVVADPSSPACRKQYCQFHPDDVRCGAE
jgi:eukaryotic-like serine/threonine-protein kinase